MHDFAPRAALLRRFRLGLLSAALSLITTAALADPCTAIPDRGPKPAYLKPGAVFGGLVRYIGDGDGLCVSDSPDPSTWVEVRLSDFYAPELHEAGGPEAKAALERLAFGRRAVCTVGGGRGGRVFSYDRVLATCTVAGVDLGDAMRSAGIREGGRGQN